MKELQEIEYRVLDALEPGRVASVAELVQKTGKDQSLITAGATLLAERGLVAVTEVANEEFMLTDEGAEVEGGRLPERLALETIAKAGGTVALAELPRLLNKKDVRAEIKWLTKKGWCARDSGVLTVTDVGRAALRETDSADERLIWYLFNNVHQQMDYVLQDAGIDVVAARALLKGRDDLVKVKTRISRRLSLTQAGEELKDKGVERRGVITQLTPEMLATPHEVMLTSALIDKGYFKKYDPDLPVAPKYPGKEHPLQRVIQEIRQAFFEMGFEEVASPTVDTAFWVFDALFQPQDHPAREMQDTFYMAEPKYGRLPDDKLVQAIARTHENGGDTGSTGWRYKWDVEKARQLVLRTHTTSASIRALAANPNPPRKVFCIGKTFRRENTDQTHLAEFMQIDGIIIDEQATLATLFGTLEAFYKKMGAEEVRFRPSFFPYTEPSAEVFAKMGSLGWIEMCGSGIFRPEVTRPLGCKVPVLAWGGGVERIAMLRFGLEDIRKLYWADIDWLRQAKLSK